MGLQQIIDIHPSIRSVLCLSLDLEGNVTSSEWAVKKEIVEEKWLMPQKAVSEISGAWSGILRGMASTLGAYYGAVQSISFEYEKLWLMFFTLKNGVAIVRADKGLSLEVYQKIKETLAQL